MNKFALFCYIVCIILALAHAMPINTFLLLSILFSIQSKE